MHNYTKYIEQVSTTNLKISTIMNMTFKGMNLETMSYRNISYVTILTLSLDSHITPEVQGTSNGKASFL